MGTLLVAVIFLAGIVAGAALVALLQDKRVAKVERIAHQYRLAFVAACENVDDLQAELRRLREEARSGGLRNEIAQVLRDVPTCPGSMEATG